MAAVTRDHVAVVALLGVADFCIAARRPHCVDACSELCQVRAVATDLLATSCYVDDLDGLASVEAHLAFGAVVETARSFLRPPQRALLVQACVHVQANSHGHSKTYDWHLFLRVIEQHQPRRIS
jgi:hypothetical protein